MGTEVRAHPISLYSPQKYVDACGDRTRAVQRLFAIVKLKTLQTSIMDRQKSKNTDKQKLESLHDA